MTVAKVRALVAREFGDDVTGAELRVRREHSGCSESASFTVEFSGRSLFVKVSDNEHACESEAASLRALADTHAVRVPQVHHVGRDDDTAYLVMTYIPMNRGNPDYAALGSALGRLHSRSQAATSTFGFDVDNYLGATPQKNTPRERDWITFFKRNRLQFQLDLLRGQRGCRDEEFVRRVGRVIDSVGSFFDAKEVIRPSLLHGDLWQGNWGFTRDGEPVIFDPACYYGHSEADLAMMTLFGHLPDTFYTAYETEMPRAARYHDRVALYQLYHALNHYNMFGVGYKSLCEELLTQLEATLPVDDARQLDVSHQQ